MEFEWSRFWQRKDSSFLQILKYILCGGFSVLVDQVFFYLMAWLVLPCLRVSDPFFQFLGLLGFSARGATESELARNYWIIKAISFVVSNAIVYFLNIRYVFEDGRHRRSVELTLFFGSSLFQFLFIWFAGILFTVFHWEVTYANLTMLLAGVVVNYFIRKHIVFKG